MIKLDVLRILEEKGKAKLWLYKQVGMSYQNFSRMVNNQTKSIRNDGTVAPCRRSFLLPECLSSWKSLRSGKNNGIIQGESVR